MGNACTPVCDCSPPLNFEITTKYLRLRNFYQIFTVSVFIYIFESFVDAM